MTKRLALIGGGPSALFLIRQLAEKKVTAYSVDIFEKDGTLGTGFPYSQDGAGVEHVTNVSGNEIPDFIDPLLEWVRDLPGEMVSDFQLDQNSFSDYKVVPRLLFGEYLNDQFEQYLTAATAAGIVVNVHLGVLVTELVETGTDNKMAVLTADGRRSVFDSVVVCTGHRWPKVKEGVVADQFDSPYPPVKLKSLVNRPVHIRGCSLTAVDAVRTLARNNGEFNRDDAGTLHFTAKPDCPGFTLKMHSRHAVLPGLRFHLEDPHLSRRALITRKQVDEHREQNGGFVSLDYIFEQDFIRQFRETDGHFYELIKNWKLEEFAEAAMASLTDADPFKLFADEFSASLRSIREGKSEYWKEKLAILSVAMNYPAKYLSAEDTIRFKKHLMPLISVVIAFVPQSSAEEFLALHAAGRLDLTKTEKDDEDFGPGAFVDCTGQPHLWLSDFPFQGLVTSGAVSQARVRYEHKPGAMDVPGLAITDRFRSVAADGSTRNRLYIMAVPYIGGFNPDYSGLDFCEDAAKAIVRDLAEQEPVMR